MLKGRNIRVTQWIEGRSRLGPIVVRVDADAIVPDEDPSEPCFEASVVRWLEEVQRLADAGEIEVLAKLGDVYYKRLSA